MPRSRGGRSAPARAPSAPSRPTAPAPPPRSMGNQQQSRPMSTTAQKAPPQAGTQQQSPGLFGQMASTAAGVAVGSSIGHAIGGMFGGGGSSSAAQEQQQQSPLEQSGDAYAQPMDNGLYNSQNQSAARGGYGGSSAQDQPCAADVKNFTRCMDENQGNMSICGWYMDQLKACQQAARPY